MFRRTLLLCGLLALRTSAKDEKCIIAFEHLQFTGQGKGICIEEDKCFNVETGWQNRITSVNTRGHVVGAHKSVNCAGVKTLLGLKNSSLEDLHDLRRLGLDDTIKSFSYAPDHEDTAALAWDDTWRLCDCYRRSFSSTTNGGSNEKNQDDGCGGGAGGGGGGAGGGGGGAGGGIRITIVNTHL